jgi:hypothetical protein
MDAVSLLEHDHETVRKLLRELDESNSRGQRKRQQLLERVSAEIEAHAAIEEEIFYPSFRERGETEDDEKLFFEAAEEHQLVHWLLPELKATDPGSELFSARAKVLRDLIEHHAERRSASSCRACASWPRATSSCDSARCCRSASASCSGRATSRPTAASAPVAHVSACAETVNPSTPSGVHQP